MKRLSLAIGLVATLLSAACSDYGPAAPSNNANSLLGTWTSVSSAPSTAGTCASFQWSVTEVSGLTGSGTFSATCFGTLQVTGTGSGTFAGTSIGWKVSGTATGAGGSCAISASGSASLQSDGGILIPYSGTTCLGPVSGTQTIRKR